MTAAAKRRWPRFSLRTMFVVVTVLTVCLGWLISEVKFVRERQSMREWIEAGQNGSVVTVAKNGPMASKDGKSLQTIPIWREWLGDEPIACIYPPDNLTRDKRQRMPLYFPKAVIYGRHSYRWPGGSRDVIYMPSFGRRSRATERP